MDTLKSIHVFTKIVESGSLTSAAVDTSISPAMVSKHLKHLENFVGARLLQRTTRSLRLTDEGRIYYEHCHAALAKLEELRAMLGARKGIPVGTLRIAVPPWVEVAQFQSVVNAYMRRYPQVKLDVASSAGLVNLIDDGFDLALHAAETLPDSSMIARRLAPSERVLCASPDYLKRHDRPKTHEDLSKHLALSCAGAQGEWRLFKDGQRFDVKLDRYMTIDCRLARQFVLAGMGITALPTEMIEQSLRQGQLERVLEDYRLPEYNLYVVYPCRRHLAPKVRAFIEILTEHFKVAPAASSGTNAAATQSFAGDLVLEGVLA